MIAASIWLIAVVLLVLAYRKARIGRGGVNLGAAGTGAVDDMLNEDKRKAVEIVVEGRAAAQDPEDADGNLPDLEHPRR